MNKKVEEHVCNGLPSDEFEINRALGLIRDGLIPEKIIGFIIEHRGFEDDFVVKEVQSGYILKEGMETFQEASGYVGELLWQIPKAFGGHLVYEKERRLKVKAADTLMPGHYSPEEFTRLNKQAEISFPAGEKQGYEKGVREVVENIWKSIYRTETHYNVLNNMGQPDSTGGVINLGTEYALIPIDYLRQLKE